MGGRGDWREPPSAMDGARLQVEAQAELLLAAGRGADALALLETVIGRVGHVTNPAWRRDRLLWCLAAAAVGRTEQAWAEADRLLALARRWAAPGAVGEALLVLGRLGGPAGLDRLREAVGVLSTSPRRVLHAEALVALGTAIEPADEAAAALHAGHHIAGATGAHRVVRLACAALSARGLPPPPQHTTFTTRLTSTERRVLELVEAGASVHEVGQRLFLTPNTVQRHLDSARGRLPAFNSA